MLFHKLLISPSVSQLRWLISHLCPSPEHPSFTYECGGGRGGPPAQRQGAGGDALQQGRQHQHGHHARNVQGCDGQQVALQLQVGVHGLDVVTRGDLRKRDSGETFLWGGLHRLTASQMS